MDTINGFIEVYLDPRGIKGSWEALVFYVDPEKTKTIKTIGDNAQWFEDHMPHDAEVTASRTSRASSPTRSTSIVETGDSGPVTPIGINLPNDQRIREQYGSKSVSLVERRRGLRQVRTPGTMRGEFSWTPEEAERGAKFGSLADELHTDMHEVIGHASGQQAAGFKGTPQQALKEHFSALEEGRARSRRASTSSPTRSWWSSASFPPPTRTTSSARIRGLHAQRARAAAARARGHARSTKTTCATAR